MRIPNFEWWKLNEKPSHCSARATGWETGSQSYRPITNLQNINYIMTSKHFNIFFVCVISCQLQYTCSIPTLWPVGVLGKGAVEGSLHCLQYHRNCRRSLYLHTKRQLSSGLMLPTVIRFEVLLPVIKRPETEITVLIRTITKPDANKTANTVNRFK